MTDGLNNFSDYNAGLLKKAWAGCIVSDYRSGLNEISAKGSQVVIQKDGTVYLTTRDAIFEIKPHDANVKKYLKDHVMNTEFMSGTPDGHVLIEFSDGSKLDVKDIMYGRCFDFIQDIKPRQINTAAYDTTIRGQNPQLLDPDHAEEIDRLRRWMQDGHISQYEFDDLNPAYPKAGK